MLYRAACFSPLLMAGGLSLQCIWQSFEIIFRRGAREPQISMLGMRCMSHTEGWCLPELFEACSRQAERLLKDAQRVVILASIVEVQAHLQAVQ